MIRGRLHLKREGGGGASLGAERTDPEYIEVDGADLTGVIKIPGWLRDIGLMAWLIVGVTVFLLGMVWLASLTSVIVIPVIVAAIVAAVLSPAVAWLQPAIKSARSARRSCAPRGDRRGCGDHGLIIGGVTGRRRRSRVTSTTPREDLGRAARSRRQLRGSDQCDQAGFLRLLRRGVQPLLRGVAATIAELSSFAFFIAMVVLSLFFPGSRTGC